MGSDKREKWVKRREASEAKVLAEREASAAACESEPPIPTPDPSSDDGSTTTTANTVTSKVDELMQTYHNSKMGEQKDNALAYIMYAAGDEMYAHSSTNDWRLQHVIEAVTAALKDVNTVTTTEENANHHVQRRIQSESEPSALPPHAHIHSKDVEEASDSPVLRRLNEYPKWNSESCSWQAWYQGLDRAYHDDCAAGLDPANHAHALAAWNVILDKVPQHVMVALLSEGILNPERPDPSLLLTALDKLFGLGM
ncbi:hypothetical protein NEUTE1DRAFT_43075 [Neurospora tetrasperma FGSC 2508]|uniref:Uncharacterized protein n=1 Tax=Neurospora tetrasperma (strain FGSC 2508 / ATCC MYA-4615 / P0657) TaxID=510951 RepID=F8MKV4_NEUT8|nr:uncharacterized protein NEUTE1DRAFT_43075 [Neurospora tetrasperma FGSC 2508]EGO57482.1 hypothetical protein NEUTE1DRAFT_43075 [Neurospora tetrasperma FGSC 2508]EGZ72260.1 hypothetical protein NEUTE2DRAFT_65067 [Neurospora tetrasperma FGSC 2509]